MTAPREVISPNGVAHLEINGHCATCGDITRHARWPVLNSCDIAAGHRWRRVPDSDPPRWQCVRCGDVKGERTVAARPRLFGRNTP